MEEFKCCKMTLNFTAFLIICLLVGVKSYEGNCINNSYHQTGRGAQGGNMARAQLLHPSWPSVIVKDVITHDCWKPLPVPC